MFKKFTAESISSNSQVKSSIQRGIRTAILEQYPGLQDTAEELLPKKQAIIVVKCKEHINLIVVGTDILFFNERDGPYYPTIRTLHKYPTILPRFQVDRGAIKYPHSHYQTHNFPSHAHNVLAGANIMCPGLTSPGANLQDDVPANAVVISSFTSYLVSHSTSHPPSQLSYLFIDGIYGVFAEGKQHAIAIGLTKLSTSDIKTLNKGIGVDNIHYLNDGLWVMKTIE